MVSPWRNRLARSAVNRKDGRSRPPGDVIFDFPTGRGRIFIFLFSDYLFYKHLNVNNIFRIEANATKFGDFFIKLSGNSLI